MQSLDGQYMNSLAYLKRFREDTSDRPVAGGTRLGERCYFVKPKEFADVEHDMRMSQEEICGPVAAVIRFTDEEHAIRLAHGTRYRLAARGRSGDRGRVHRFIRRLKAGTVWVNTF